MSKDYDAVSKDNHESWVEIGDIPPSERGAYEKLSLEWHAHNSIAKNYRLSVEKFALRRHEMGRHNVALIPERLDPHLITWQDLPSPEAEQQYKRLAVSLILAAARRSFRRVLLVSAQHGEGRTTVMLNLAGMLARAKLRVLVVDTDFVRPSVLRLLGVEADAGLVELFSNRGDAREALITLLPLGITILGTRQTVETSAEILGAPKFRELLSLLENDFDFILLDSPPLLDSADANLLMHLVDTTLLVIRPDTVSTAQMARAVALLKREDISGVVMNRVVQK